MLEEVSIVEKAGRKRSSSESSLSADELNGSPSKHQRARSPTAYCRNVVFDDPSQIPNLQPRAAATVKRLVAQLEKKHTFPLFAWGRMTLTIRPLAATDTGPVIELWKPRRHEIVGVLAYIYIHQDKELMSELGCSSYELVFDDETRQGYRTALRSRKDDFVAIQREINTYWGVHKRQLCPAVIRKPVYNTHYCPDQVFVRHHGNDRLQFQESEPAFAAHNHNIYQPESFPNVYSYVPAKAHTTDVTPPPISRVSPTLSLSSDLDPSIHYSPSSPISPAPHSPRSTSYFDSYPNRHHEHRWSAASSNTDYYNLDSSRRGYPRDSGVAFDDMTPASSPRHDEPFSPEVERTRFRNSMDLLAYVALNAG